MGVIKDDKHRSSSPNYIIVLPILHRAAANQDDYNSSIVTPGIKVNTIKLKLKLRVSTVSSEVLFDYTVNRCPL